MQGFPAVGCLGVNMMPHLSHTSFGDVLVTQVTMAGDDCDGGG